MSVQRPSLAHSCRPFALGQFCCCDGEPNGACFARTNCTCTPAEDGSRDGEVTCEDLSRPLCPQCEPDFVCPPDQPQDGTPCTWFDEECEFEKCYDCCNGNQCFPAITCTCLRGETELEEGEVACYDVKPQPVCPSCEIDPHVRSRSQILPPPVATGLALSAFTTRFVAVTIGALLP